MTDGPLMSLAEFREALKTAERRGWKLGLEKAAAILENHTEWRNSSTGEYYLERRTFASPSNVAYIRAIRAQKRRKVL